MTGDYRSFMNVEKSGNMTGSNENHVARLTKLFTVFEHMPANSKTIPSIDSAHSLGMY